MNTLSTTTSLLTHSLVWALLYSLWQGALIYGTLYALLKALPNTGARIKYYLSFGALMVVFLWFADTWATQYQKLKGVTVYISPMGTEAGDATVTYPVKTVTVNTVQHNVLPGNILHDTLPKLEQYFPFIIMLYMIGLVFMLFRFGVNIWQVKTLRKHGIIEPEQKWNLLLEQLQEKFELSRPVRLFLSSHINVPMMLGVVKPIILLPIATINNLSTEQVEAILMHELAHIKRHDYLLNLLQTTIETILFFNPFVWLVSSVIRREREHCCDDLVVARSASPLSYVKALAILEQNRSNNNDLVLAATGKKKLLFNRIKRIMEMKKNNVNYSQLTIIVIAIMAITFSVAMFTFSPSFAQQAKIVSDNDTSVARKHVYKYKTVTVDSNGKRTETVKETTKPWRHVVKDDDDDNNNNNVTVKIIDDNNDDNKKPGTSGSSYSYSYSNKDGEDMSKAIAEIAIAAQDIAASAISSIDFKELEKEMDNAQKEMKDVDWNEVRAEIRKGLAEVDKELGDEKMHKEINVQVKEALEKSKEALEKAQKELKKTQIKMEARTSTGNGKAGAYVTDDNEEENTSTVNYESMLGKMAKEGLIDRSKSYKIAKEHGVLYINGKKQPATVYNEYKQYLNGNKISIKGSKGNLSISVTND